MSPKRADIPEECFSCPLPDCHDTDPRCPVLRRKAEAKGITLPPVEMSSYRPRERRKHEGIVPVSSKDRTDYQRQYNAEYNRRFKRVIPHGVKVRRCDLEILERVAAAEGRTFGEELIILIEIMAENARERGWS